MRRVVLVLPVLVLFVGCSLLTQFDPQTQPCDSLGGCLAGYSCVEGLCLAVDGGAERCTPACAAGDRCVGGACYPSQCGGLTCGSGTVCVDGGCLLATCAGINCNAGSVCVGGACEASACGTSTCVAGEACRGGACVDVSCTGVTCAGGLQCLRGACVGCASTETRCGDGLDDDCDQLVDCADTDCTAQLCDDGNPCTEGERCASGTCMRGAAKACDTPPSACQSARGTCEAATGQCAYPNIADATICGSSAAMRCCSGTCVDLTQTSGNCGGCGTTCTAGQACQPLEQSGCMGEPARVSGRCECGAGVPCPRGQICTLGHCSPVDASQCAPNQLVPVASTCSSYCRY